MQQVTPIAVFLKNECAGYTGTEAVEFDIFEPDMSIGDQIRMRQSL